jgi:hypothetical protein
MFPVENIALLKQMITSEYILPAIKADMGESEYGTLERVMLQRRHMETAALVKTCREKIIADYDTDIPIYKVRRLEFPFTESNRESTKKKAELVLETILDGSRTFADQVKKYAPTGQQAENAGLLDFRSLDLLPASVAVEIPSMQPGEVLNRVLVAESTCLLIELVESSSITFKQLGKIENPTTIAMRIYDIESGKMMENFTRELGVRFPVQKEYDLVKKGSDDVILQVGDEYVIDYRFLSYRIGYNLMTPGERRNYSRTPSIPEEALPQDIMLYLDTVLVEEGLLYCHAIATEMDQEPAYRSFIDRELMFFYAGVNDHFFQKEIAPPTEDQLLQYYNNNLDFFTDGEHLFDTNQKRTQPFEQVRDTIIEAVTGKELHERAVTWEKQLLDSYNVSWNEKSLAKSAR